MNSARRVASLWHRFTVTGELASHLSTVDGPVLLIDDYADTGWTATIEAERLRRNSMATRSLAAW